MYRVIVDYKDPRAGGAWRGPAEPFDKACERYGVECARICKGGIRAVVIERLKDSVIVASATS